MADSVKHVLGLSGGRDSAALAVYMRQYHPELEIEYFFTDTGKELPEVYEYLGRLEGLLGRPILRLNPDRDFDFWLKQYNGFLPSAQTRWCTRQLKLRPFEHWVRPMLNDGAKPFTATSRSAATNHTGKATLPSTKTSSCDSLSRRQVSTKQAC